MTQTDDLPGGTRRDYTAALCDAEAATDRVRDVAPLIAEALRAWAEVVINLAVHDLNNMRTVVAGEHDLAAMRDLTQTRILARLDSILTRLDTIDARLERGDARFDILDRAVGLARPAEGQPRRTDACARCGQALDPVSPGYSVVAGGSLVCATCLAPGEEVARARSTA